jgi:hypothetical protein
MYRTCEYCGLTHKTRRKKDRIRFCSITCRNAAFDKDRQRICAVCQTPFTANDKQQLTCSNTCSIFHTKQIAPTTNDDFRTCKKCKVTKPISDYYRRRAGHQTICKDCTKVRTNEHWHKNKKSIIAHNNIRRQELTQWYNDLKSTGCSICGEKHPAALDFHHINKEEKEYNIYDMIGSNRSKAAILAEIKKCKILCANCHRKHHWDERKAAH